MSKGPKSMKYLGNFKKLFSSILKNLRLQRGKTTINVLRKRTQSYFKYLLDILKDHPLINPQRKYYLVPSNRNYRGYILFTML